MRDFSPIFNPQNIAVVGASTKPLSVGYEMVKCILEFGFTGAVFPINLKAHAVMGIKAYPSLTDVPFDIDLAIIVVPGRFVLPTMEECARTGVKSAIVITAGFKEVSEAGAKEERKIAQIAKDAGILLVGPNCMGAFNTNPATLLNATFARKLPKPGKIGFISQSGAMGAAVLDYADERHIGFSKFISIGNKADVDENDCLEAFADDDEVGVVVLYLENFEDPLRFSEIASKITPNKPVLVLKSGRSATGAKAASSHTGALADSDTAVDAMLDRCGAMRLDSIEDLLIMAHMFSYRNRPAGNRLGLITNAGGPGIIATDELERNGFTFPTLDPATVAELGESLPPEASHANPCDVLPGTGPNGYRVAAEALVKDPNLDAVVILFLCPSMVKPKWLVDAIVPVVENSDKPVIGLFMGASDILHSATPLVKAGMPIFSNALEVAKGINASLTYAQIQSRKIEKAPEIKVDNEAARAIMANHPDGWLENSNAFNLLNAYGIPIVKDAQVSLDGDITKAAASLGYPLVMKIISPDILHKSDAGGVKIGITDESELQQNYNEMLTKIRSSHPEAKLEGILFQQMITYDRELIIGIDREPGFGPMVMCGMGGVFVEILKDVKFALAPVTVTESKAMLEGLGSAPLLQGARGTASVDLQQVADVVARISKLAVDYPEIEQLDINPLLAGANGCCAVDVRIKVSR